LKIDQRISDLLARHGRAQQPGALCKLGDALLRTGQFDEALQCFDRALKMDPRCARAWAGRGAALSKLNRVGEALACAERALENDGTLDAAFVLKGDLLRRVGSLDEALACYDSAHDLAPDDARVLLGRAELLTKIGRHDEAAKSYARALDMDPENADAWYGLVVARSAALDADGARKALDRFVAIAHDDPRVVGARSLVAQIERRCLASKAPPATERSVSRPPYLPRRRPGARRRPRHGRTTRAETATRTRSSARHPRRATESSI
jgi:tetratricopeptide (TPR) repeat protein